jgi:hypothetical protein
MAKRPGHVDVVTEVGFCNFCNRTRNLRREEHRLGALVRTIVSCETCHRTLSSSMGVAAAEPEPTPEPAKVEEPAAATKPVVKQPAAKKPAAAKPAAKKPAAKKPAPKKAATARPKTPPKPRSTATRKATTKK